MKLAVLGGGGVRSPYLAKYLAKNAKLINVDEIIFMDDDAEKLRVYGGLSQKVAKHFAPELQFLLTTSAKEAVKDADYIITTLRVGQDASRVIDERTALKHGVIGQETTGAGGFAMALRSIPALEKYCALVREHAKEGALIFNFTNPSGLVTQYLRNAGFSNVYGICDGPYGFLKELAHMLQANEKDFSVECFGLNHLSWFRSIKLGGKELLPQLLSEARLYQETEMKLFAQEAIIRSGLLPSAYLYFYYYQQKALQNVSGSSKTRGEIIVELNNKMYAELKDLDIEHDFVKMLKIHSKYYKMRELSYMAVEEGKVSRGTVADVEGTLEILEDGSDNEGYSGIALKFIRAVSTGKAEEVILSVPNDGAMEGLAADDVIEVTCFVDKKGAKALTVGKVPEGEMELICAVKEYERLAVSAIKNKSRKLAAEALFRHPLVNDRTIAEKLVSEYLSHYRQYVGEWQ